MTWEHFLEIRSKLNTVCEQLSQENAMDGPSLKGLVKHSIYFFSMRPPLSVLTEDNFKDLSYRYMASDEDLKLLNEELNSFLK